MGKRKEERQRRETIAEGERQVIKATKFEKQAAIPKDEPQLSATCNEEALTLGMKDRHASDDNLIESGNLWQLMETMRVAVTVSGLLGVVESKMS